MRHTPVAMVWMHHKRLPNGANPAVLLLNAGNTVVDLHFKIEGECTRSTGAVAFIVREVCAYRNSLPLPAYG